LSSDGHLYQPVIKKDDSESDEEECLPKKHKDPNRRTFLTPLPSISNRRTNCFMNCVLQMFRLTDSPERCITESADQVILMMDQLNRGSNISESDVTNYRKALKNDFSNMEQHDASEFFIW